MNGNGDMPLDSQKILLKSLILASFALALAGCASSQLTPAIDAAEEPREVTIQEDEPVDPVQQEPELPKVELTQELLEQLLVVSFAPYAGDLDMSAEQALLAAKTSQDHRLASFAAVTGLRIRNYALAQEAAQLWLDLVADNRGAQTTLILASLGLGDAETAYEQILLRDADLSLEEQTENSARLLIGQRNSEAAIKVAERFIDDNPGSHDALLSAAYVADNFEINERAEEWLTSALDLKPDWDRAAQLQASVLRRQGKDEERAEFIKGFLERNPKSVSMRINHAAELARAESYDEAFTLMEAVISDDPRNVAALNYAAALAEHLKRDDEAKGLYRRVLRLEPQNDEVYWSLARFAVREKNYQRAEDYYQEISGERLYFRAQLQVANMRYQTRGLKEAINTLRALEPRTEDEYIEQATTRHYLLMQEHQHEEAFAAINETLIYLPENLDLRYARALVAAELKEIETAEKDLRYVIAQQPENADALNALGYTLADQTDRLEEAKELISQALELRPESAHIIDSMGWILYRLGDLEEAETFLRQAYDKGPQAEIAAHLGEVLWELGRTDEARVVWSEGFADDENNPVLLATLKKYGVDAKVELANATKL